MFDSTFLDKHSHALVDQLAGDGQPGNFPAHAVVPIGLEKDAHLLPLLIPLRDLTPEQYALLLENLAQASAKASSPMCTTLLATAAETKYVQAHLAARLLIRLFGIGKGKALLRYYDPRVFAQLQWMLSRFQMRALFGPFNLWSVYLDGAWRTVQRPQLDLSNWVFDANCCARLARIGLINEVLLGLSPLLGDTRTETGKAIDASLVYAQQRYQFERDEDRVAFALHAMTVHREFDRHPAIQNLIEQLKQQSQTYTDATALLNESDWRRIGIDLSI